jgi:hypothetical protein
VDKEGIWPFHRRQALAVAAANPLRYRFCNKRFQILRPTQHIDWGNTTMKLDLRPDSLLDTSAKATGQVAFVFEIDAEQYPSALLAATRDRIVERITGILRARGMKVLDDEGAPKLVLFATLKAVRECSTGVELHLLRIESYLRERVTLVRDPLVEAFADVWRHPAELVYYPIKSDARVLEVTAAKIAVRQIKRFTESGGLSLNGRVRNRSSTRSLWVVEIETGQARAHKLSPGRQSPPRVDAEGLRACDGTPISGHNAWWRIRDVGTAEVADSSAALKIDCLTCAEAGDIEFGAVQFDGEDGWGDPI